MKRIAFSVCLGLLVACAAGAQERPRDRAQDRAQDRAARRDIRQGRIVSVAPDQNMIIVQEGTGADVKEVELKVSDATRYMGIDRKPFTNGLRYEGFKKGTTIWYRVGAGNRIMEVDFFNPAREATDEKVVYLEGKIIRVDPETGMVVIKTGMGDTAKEIEYKVDRATKYYGTEEKPLADGLRYQGFKEGTTVWYQVAPSGQVISDVRFYNPVRRPLRPRR